MANPSYTIEKGDTLWDLAKRWGTTVGQIVDANPALAKNPNKLKIGQEVAVPEYKGPRTTGPNPPFQFPSPYQSSWTPFARGQDVPVSPESPPSGNPYDLIDVGPRPPGLYPDRVASRAFESATGFAKGLWDTVKAPREYYTGERDIQGPQAIQDAVNLALLTMGGGAGGVKEPLPRGLPEGEIRNLPAQRPATGRLGLAQRAERAGALNDPGVDPMWVDTVLRGRPPTGNVPPGEPGTVLGSGPIREGNVIRPEFGKTRIPKDPKANLERRMQKRTGQSGDIIPPDEYYYQKSMRYAKEAAKENQARRAQEFVNTPSAKQAGQAARNEPLSYAQTYAAHKENLVKKGVFTPESLAENERLIAQMDDVTLMAQVKEGLKAYFSPGTEKFKQALDIAWKDTQKLRDFLRGQKPE